VNPACRYQPQMTDGNGFPVMRGQGRGRRGSGVVCLTGVNRGRVVAARPSGACGAASGYGVQQQGMLIRGCGRVAGGPPHGYPEETVMRNTLGSADSQKNAFRLGHLSHTVMNDASVNARDSGFGNLH